VDGRGAVVTRREALIVQLLRARGFAEPGGGGQPAGYHDAGVALLPHDERCRINTSNGRLRCSCWLRSLAELERRLAELRVEERKLWEAVHARFVACERRPRVVYVKRGRPLPVAGWEVLGLVDRTQLNTHGTGSCRLLVESWDSRVSEAEWTAGISWLSERFRGPLNLPAEMVSGVAA
jgi:hypothetical protein